MTLTVNKNKPTAAPPLEGPGEVTRTPEEKEPRDIGRGSLSALLKGYSLQPKARLFEPGRLSAREEGAEFKMQKLPGQPDWYPENLHITIDDGPRLADDRLPDILAVR